MRSFDERLSWGAARHVVTMLTEEMRYKLMRLLQANPHMSQRDTAKALGISVGKVNYCVRALIRKGLVKVQRFKNSRNRAAYLYLLTPRGIEAKSELTVRFLRAHVREYELLGQEIAQIRAEIGTQRRADEPPLS